MLSRRIIRIKALQALYAHYSDSDSSIQSSEKQLFFSIEKSYEQYFMFLLLPVYIRNYALERIDIARQKKIPTNEDLNPNTRFIENKIITQIDDNIELLKYYNNKKISWVKYPELIKNFYNDLIQSDYYNEYMTSEDPPDYNYDKKLVNFIYKDIIAPSDDLYAVLEEQSIYWNDEPEFIISIVCKTIESFKPDKGPNCSLLPLFKNEDDKIFTRDLLRKAILKNDEYRGLIQQYAKNWEIERIAFIDILLIQLAITEIVEFSQIPIKVSMNEYIEISKYYSTEKSNVFLNGMIDQIVNHLKDQNKIVKKGRGLVGEE